MNKYGRKYISNKDLLPEVMMFKETGKVSEELGEMLLHMGYKYATKGNFANYTWKDDMVQQSIEICLNYLKNFDPTKQKKPNPFAYITTIFKNAFINYIKKQNRHSKIKDTCYNRRDVFLEGPLYMNKGIDYQKIKEE